MNFALRVSGPPVQQITRAESLENLKASNPLFFVYVGEHAGLLWVSTNVKLHITLLVLLG